MHTNRKLCTTQHKILGVTVLVKSFSAYCCYYAIARLSADSMDIDSARQHDHLECSRQVNPGADLVGGRIRVTS